MVQSVQITRHLPKLTRIDDPTISFIENDAQWLYQAHNNVLIISLLIADFNTQRVLVDKGSTDNILYYLAFQQMRIDKEWLLLSDMPFVGFSGSKVFLVGTVTLPVTIGTYP